MNTTISNIRIFKTQEAAAHTVLTIFYMFREIPRIKSVSSKNRSSTLWRLYSVTDFFFGIFRNYPEQCISKKLTDSVCLSELSKSQFIITLNFLKWL